MFKQITTLVKTDLYRICGKANFQHFLYQLFLGESFKVIFWYRVSHAFWKTSNMPMLFLTRLFLRHSSIKFGIILPKETQIGSGFYIGHFGGIVINKRTIIGNNCNISHGVTIGNANRGAHPGVPVIGNCVYIGPGAKIFGAIKIGDGAAIGANAVVTQDVPENAVAVGIPAKIISANGSSGYINNTDYPFPLNE